MIKQRHGNHPCATQNAGEVAVKNFIAKIIFFVNNVEEYEKVISSGMKSCIKEKATICKSTQH